MTIENSSYGIFSPLQHCYLFNPLQHCCSGDFLVVFNSDGDDDKNCSIFHFLEQACFELAEVSYKINNSRMVDAQNLPSGHRPLYRNFLYSRMLWGKGVREGEGTRGGPRMCFHQHPIYREDFCA